MATKTIRKVSEAAIEIKEGVVLDTLITNSSTDAPSVRAVNEALSGLTTTTLDITITSDMWVQEGTLYKATIPWAGITENHIVDVNFNLESLELASDVKNYTESGTNCFYLYSDNVVTNTLIAKAYAKVVI